MELKNVALKINQLFSLGDNLSNNLVRYDFSNMKEFCMKRNKKALIYFTKCLNGRCFIDKSKLTKIPVAVHNQLQDAADKSN